MIGSESDPSALGVDIERGGAMAWLTLYDRRKAALGEQLLSRISDAFAELEDDDSVHAICLLGLPDVFLAGADTPFFVRALVARDLERILTFTRTAHALLRRIASSRKPVISWIRGPALGAGLELALACQMIVASPTAKFALPETTLGIYPGMGGTQRMPRRIGTGLAKWMIFTGSIVPAAQALEIGLIDAVGDESELMDLIDAQRNNALGPRPELSGRWATLEKFFDEHRISELLNSAFEGPSDPRLVRALVQVRRNAPIALGLAETLIDEGTKLPLDAGIEQEFNRLREVFLSEDALTGLLTFGKSRPTFDGR